MKQVLIVIISIFSHHMHAQENGHELFKAASSDFSSFGESFKNDSIISFKSSKGYFPSLLKNLGYQGSFITRLKEKDAFIIAGAAIIGLTFYNYDERIDDAFKPVSDKNPFIASVSPHITELGDYYGYMLLAGYGSYTILFHKYRGFRTALLASQAAIASGIWTRVGKVLTGRMRPGQTYGDKEYNSDHWFGPFGQFKHEYNSKRNIPGFDAFPSGHTGAAFAMATVFSEQYKDVKAIPITMYSLAGIVGITRMIEHEHWASDVFLGGIIGYLCGKQVVAAEKKKFPAYTISKRKRTTSYFFPVNHSGIGGLGWKMEF